MGYVENNLLKEERIVLWSRPHWIIFSTSILVFIFGFIILLLGRRHFSVGLTIFSLEIYQILALICFVIAFLVGARDFILYRTSEYAVTNKRILMKKGWISRDTMELFLSKVEALHVSQTVPGRLLDYGTLVVVGTGGSQDPLGPLPNPLQFRAVAQEQVGIDLGDIKSAKE